jgi:hypothetical protein
LRAHKPLTGDDWGYRPGDDWARLEKYLLSKVRRRRWPKWLIAVLWHKAPTHEDYDRLADLIEQIGRRRGVANDPVHEAAKLAHAFIYGRRLPTDQRDAIIQRACDIVEDEKRCPEIERESVYNLLAHPGTRLYKPRP